MAEDTKLGAIYIPEKTWWQLRKKLAQTWPKGEVTPSYLATLLGVSDGVAKTTLSALRAIGFIDDSGRFTDRANRWRDDHEYPKVCAEVLSEAFPQELRDLFPTYESTDISKLRGWFKTKLRVGDDAARQRAATYMLLLKADPTEPPTTPVRTTPTSNDGAGRTRPKGSVTSQRPQQGSAYPEAGATGTVTTALPERAQRSGTSLHIDIEIHISPDSSAEQIDKIFESMAKHLNVGK